MACTRSHLPGGALEMLAGGCRQERRESSWEVAGLGLAVVAPRAAVCLACAVV